MSDRQIISLSNYQKESLAQGVFRALRSAILDGTLKPGDWLRQESLAEELDVSQTTIRDAFNQLIGEGLATRIPYKGVQVISLSESDLEDIYAMRAVLEGMAAELAAAHITADQLQEMKELLPVTIVSNDPDTVATARKANRRFHEIFIEASQRRFLIRVLRQILDWIDPLMLYSKTKNTEIGLETRLKWGERDRFQHARLLKALEEGDSKQAGRYAKEAVEEAWTNLTELTFEKNNRV